MGHTPRAELPAHEEHRGQQPGPGGEHGPHPGQGLRMEQRATHP
ncbi:MAG: hypothetical protein ACRDQA_19860 [Nocardioidaceae bacterium]